jgi:hypothetical protein
MESPRSRLALGIAAVAFVAGLCIVAVWSVRGRLPAPPAPVAVAPVTADAPLRAENLRLRADVARLTAERDAALAKPQPAPEPPARSTAPAPSPAPVRPQHASKPAAPAQPEGFSEPQTFTSVSTAY